MDDGGDRGVSETDKKLPIEDFQAICLLVCPHCRQQRPLSKRSDTAEWVHDWKEGAGQSHTLCWATGLRNSEYAPSW